MVARKPTIQKNGLVSHFEIKNWRYEWRAKAAFYQLTQGQTLERKLEHKLNQFGVVNWEL